jgi:phosphohistidine phosphatase
VTRLIHVFRHAKSSWADPDQDDRDRPLAPRGKRAARAMAKHMRAVDVAPALVLCSPAKRARQTLELIAPALGTPEMLTEKGLYAASAEELLERLRALPDSVPSVMIVGHNPGLQDLAGLLVRDAGKRAKLVKRFPTAALATLAIEQTWRELDSGTADLVAYADPHTI